ncbi:MAG: NTP transferase domain-containing protein [Oligosphaeraceae bacterium]|nr:NTP transferase domain-containing protein [Oligosphaeraceae bacterium]
MPGNIPDYTVILAAGRGTRMRSPLLPKVCFKINGVPAINRALRIYQDSGIERHLVVVGNLAGQVIETVGAEFDNVAYVYQKEQLGTANALRCLTHAMPELPPDSNLLVVAGDRIVEQSVLEKLFDQYFSSKADLALLATRCETRSAQGRIVVDNQGEPLAIVECADIRQRKTYRRLREKALLQGCMSCAELRQLIVDEFFVEADRFSSAKAEAAFPGLWAVLGQKEQIKAEQLLGFIPEKKTRFVFEARDGRILLEAEEAAALPYGNTSVYLIKYGLLRLLLSRLSRDNAQQEEYLSDLMNLVYRHGTESGKPARICVLRLDEPGQVLGFNNPAELLEVEKALREKSRPREAVVLDERHFRSLAQWQAYFAGWQEPGSPAARMLQKIYGEDEEIIARQAALLCQVLQEYAQNRKGRGADDQVGLVRMPGRLNVMGRHVDHQGGNCNLMTISFETIMLVHPRQDDLVTLHHCDSARFAGTSFSVSELLAELPWEDWNSVVSSEALMKRFKEYGVDWSEYVKAAVLRLQKKFATEPLRGMDLVVAGNIPMAAGLSSSSSLIVGAAEAAVAVNALPTFPAQLVTLCGEGEWFVGTRGGSADHAAVKLGSQGSVVKVRFFPFAVEESVLFPAEHVMLVCDSGIKARKSSSAKDQFNHRISCYRIGFELIKHLFPQYRSLLQHLRDVNVRTLQVPLANIYRILLALPEKATLPELQAMLPHLNVEQLCAGHKAPEDGMYPIRGVVLFGLSEAERSAAYIDCLKKGDMAQIGRMMQVSHDGDRVSSFSEDWQELPFHAPIDNAYLLQLLADLESGLPERVIAAQLLWQPGAYACSLPAIDLMVDIALRSPGVEGAQLAGAGLGGCMMVLCRADHVDQLKERLQSLYYERHGLNPASLVCRPVAGGGMLIFDK